MTAKTNALRSQRVRDRVRERGERIIRSKVSDEIASVLDERARAVGLDRSSYVARLLAVTALAVDPRDVASATLHPAAPQGPLPRKAKPHGDV